MSKNIFNVLARHDDSDDEGRPKVNNKPNQAKPSNPANNGNAPRETKKEVRAKDTQLREKYGDTVDKDARGPGPRYGNQKPKDDYGANEKRPYERHSGTGRPAFKKNDYKKGGHGKGNVGGDPEKPEDVQADGENAVNVEDNVEPNVAIVKLPEEEIVTLDDYISNTGHTFGLKGDNKVRNKDPKAFEDANTKAIVSKRAQNNAEDTKKSNKQVEKKQGNKNIVEVAIGDNDQRRRDNRQGNRQGYVKYDKNEFPSLD